MIEYKDFLSGCGAQPHATIPPKIGGKSRKRDWGVDMRSKACCFTGHRQFYGRNANEIGYSAARAIEGLIKDGVTVFKAGGAVGFDTVCALEVLRLRENYPAVRLELILPCKRQERNWNVRDKKLYREILEAADSVEFLAEQYYDGCMQMRNRALVNGSDYCIAYLARHYGGTYYTVTYAKEQGLEVILI